MERLTRLILLVCTLGAVGAFGALPSLMAHGDAPHDDRLLLCEELPGERTISFHFFNLINAEEFQNGNREAKASFKEEDPLVYKINKAKKECSMNVADMSMNFEEETTWELQSGNPDLVINTANIQFLRFGHVCPSTSYNCKMSFKELVDYNNETYIRQNVTINDLLMKGVNTSTFNTQMSGHQKEDLIDLPLPELRTESYAIYPPLNRPKKFTLNSDPDTFGKIMKLDGKTKLSWWESETNPAICSQITGTDGAFFYGDIKETSTLHFYSEDLGSIVTLKFKEKDTSIGVPAFKFVFVENMLDSSSCFCPEPGMERENCLPHGAIDAKYTQNGLPYIMSYPNFYEADDSYLANVDGLKVDQVNQESYFIIEPITKTVLESSLKIQLNVDLKIFPKETKEVQEISVRDTIFPMYWADKKFKLDSVHVEAIKAYLESLNQPATTTAATTTTADLTTTAFATTTTTTTTTTTIPPKQEGAGESNNAELEHKLESISLQIRLLGAILLAIVVLAVLLFAAVLFSTLHGSRRNPALSGSPPSYGNSYKH